MDKIFVGSQSAGEKIILEKVNNLEMQLFISRKLYVKIIIMLE